MKRIFNGGVIILLVALMADRALVHAHGEASASACAEHATQVQRQARAQGFSALAAASQAQSSVSRCWVTGRP